MYVYREKEGEGVREGGKEGNTERRERERKEGRRAIGGLKVDEEGR